MLYDGLGAAVVAHRKEKGWKAVTCARRGGLDPKIWSKIENSKTGFGRKHYQKVLRGLITTDVELWERKVAAEIKYYRKQAIKSGDAGPQVQVSEISVYFERLNRLDAEKLTSPMNRRAFARLRKNAVHQAAMLHQTTEDACSNYREGLADEAQAESRSSSDRKPDREPSPRSGDKGSREPQS